MAAGDPIKPYRGSIKIKRPADATALVLDIIEAYSFSSEREFTDLKPKITPTSTGTRPRSPGARSGEGSLDAQITQGANAGRAALLAAERDALVCDLTLEQENGLGDTFPVYINGFEMEVDSEDGGSLSFTFVTAGEYDFVDVA